MDEGECYNYLGQDENISNVGTVNKERVFKEYSQELERSGNPSFRPSIKLLHKMFAVPG